MEPKIDQVDKNEKAYEKKFWITMLKKLVGR